MASLATPVLLLKLAISAVILFSGAIIALPELTQPLFNVVDFGAPDYPAVAPESARPYLLFVYGVLAAVMIGWMVALAAIVHIPLRRGESWAWWAVTLSIASWFVTDSTLSIVHRFPGNAVLNLIVAALFVVPLSASHRLVTGQARLI